MMLSTASSFILSGNKVDIADDFPESVSKMLKGLQGPNW